RGPQHGRGALRPAEPADARAAGRERPQRGARPPAAGPRRPAEGQGVSSAGIRSPSGASDQLVRSLLPMGASAVAAAAEHLGLGPEWPSRAAALPPKEPDR